MVELVKVSRVLLCALVAGMTFVDFDVVKLADIDLDIGLAV
jgi:hypothetical protein